MNSCTTDVCVNGQCQFIPLPDGTECDDWSGCTQDDYCMDGVCIGTIDCDDGNECTTDTCEWVPEQPWYVFACFHEPVQGSCDDGDACTENDQCDVMGNCIGTPVDCDDSNVCTIDDCVGGVCTHTPVANSCDDNDECTIGDACVDGACLGAPLDCDDGNPCTIDACDPATGCTHTPFVGACDDGDPCTINDACDNNQICVGRPNACPDSNPCTIDQCDPQTGQCTHTPRTGSCNDGDPCTENDTCVAGVCIGTPESPCDPSEPCAPDFTVDGEGYAEDFVHALSRQLVVEQGTDCLTVKVYYFSREWPVWTEQQSQYEDVLTHQVDWPGGVLTSGAVTVNSLDTVFQVIPPFPGGSVKVYDELLDYTPYTQTQDSWIQLAGSAQNIGDGLLGSGVAFIAGCAVVDLVLDGLAENDETNPGGFICAGDLPPLTGLTLSMNSPPEQATYSLTAAYSGTGRLKLYENPDRTGEITLPLSGDAADLPQDIWLEGDAASSAARDVELKLELTANTVTCEDIVNVTVLAIKLKELSFSGTKYFGIAKDDGTGDYGTPHWRDNTVPRDGDALDPGDRNIPVAFTRNTTMKISATLTIEPPNALSGSWQVVGDAVGEPTNQAYRFEDSATIASGELTVSAVPADVPLVNTVDYHQPLRISWTISSVAQGYTFPCAESTHRVYVMLDDPLPSPLFETVVDIGCRNARGLTDGTTALPAIFLEFEDRVVNRKALDGLNNTDGVQLTYYAAYLCQNVYPADLLRTGDGQCGAWAQFFLDILAAQGIDHTLEYIILEPNDGSRGFAVKNWSFAGAGASDFPGYPYLNIDDPPFKRNTSYAWEWWEGTDLTGIPGQGTTNPASLFWNHQVVKIAGTYYDPSYGVTFSSLAQIDNTVIDGYYKAGTWGVKEWLVGEDLNGDLDQNDIVPKVVHVFHTNAAGNQLVENCYEYPFP